MTHDYRWFAADTVMRKSMAALEAMQTAPAGARRLAGSPPEPTDSPLMIETERAVRMSRAALDESLESSPEPDGEAN